MTVEITPQRRAFLMIVIVAAGLLAIATWTESRDTVFFAATSLDHARQLGGKGDTQLREFSKAVEATTASGRLITYYSVAVLMLCFAAVVAMWIPRRKESLDSEPPEVAREDQ